MRPKIHNKTKFIHEKVVSNSLYSLIGPPYGRGKEEAIARLNAKGSQEADARALLMAQMMKIQKKAKASAAADAVTKAHWADLANIIEQELLKK